MALQVWLPLNGNLTNQGLSEVSVVNSGATTSDAGKIGSCYAFTTSQYMQISGIPFSTLSSCSVAFWIKIPQDFGNWLPFTGQTVYYYLMATASGTGPFYHGNAGSGTIYCDGVQRTTPINDGNWHHYCITGADLSAWTDFYINKYSSGWNWSGSMNDVRIYDHCLSPKEVSELSRGLVLHYKFDDPYVEATTNLFNYAGGGSRLIHVEGGVDVPVEAGDCYCYLYSREALVEGDTYTLSFDVSNMKESEVCNYGFYYNGGMHYVTPLHNGRCSIVIDSAPPGSSLTFDDYGRNNTDIIHIRNFQLEKKDHATPYTPTSRDTGKIYDSSGYGYNGVVTGNLQAQESSARGNYCTKFSGSESVDVGKQLYSITDSITISCWCKYTNANIRRLLSCTEGGGWNFEDIPWEGRFNFAMFTSKGAYSPSIYSDYVNDGTWHMITGTFDGRYKKIYTDGVLTDSTDLGATYKIVYNTDVNLYVGQEAPSGENANGCMSDVRIYSTALSAEDILELYNTSASIDNKGNLECYEAIENNSSIDITKTGLFETQNFIEPYDYIYLPAGTDINTEIQYAAGDSCATTTVIRYASEGTGRDLMGYSGSGAGYWGVTDGGAWELHGNGTYSNADITIKNTIQWSFHSGTEYGTYRIGSLSTYWTPRNKYIYRVKLYKNDVLQLDLYPAKQGDTCGMMDALTGDFYPASTSAAAVGNDGDIVATFYEDKVELNQLIEI